MHDRRHLLTGLAAVAASLVLQETQSRRMPLTPSEAAREESMRASLVRRWSPYEVWPGAEECGP